MGEKPLAQGRWSRWAADQKLHLMVLAGSGLIAYGNSLNVPFVLDDFHVLVGNPIVENFQELLGKSLVIRPRSLVDLTFALQVHLHGLKVLPLHVLNLFIHCLNGFLAYFVTVRLFGLVSVPDPDHQTQPFVKQWPAFVAAALFILHPVQTQAVTYITQRYTSLMAFFYLAAVWAFLRFRQERRPFFAVLLGVFAYLAFLCKQSALTLPLSLLALEGLAFSEHRRFWGRWGVWLLVPGLLALLGIVWNIGVLTGNYGSAGDFLEDVDRLSRETLMVSRSSYFFTQLRVLCRYIVLVLWPLGQCVDPHYPFVHRFFEGWTPLAAACLLALLMGAWRIRHRAPLVSLGVLWFFSTLSLESSFIPIRDAMFEHRLYLAVLGFGWILVGILLRLPWPDHRSLVVPVCLLLILLGVATHRRNQIWQNPISLWQEAILCNPQNARAFNNLGRHLIDAGRLNEAEVALSRALALSPFRRNVYYNLGMIYARTKRLEPALRSFATALSLDPRQPSFYYHLGLTYHHMGLTQAARECYEAALLHSSTMLGPAMNLAALAFNEGRYEDARNILENLTQRFPKSAKPFYHLSLVLRAQGRNAEAINVLEKALQIEPRNPEALFQKALLFMDTQRLEEALPILRLLKELNPHDERVSFYLDKLSAPKAQDVR